MISVWTRGLTSRIRNAHARANAAQLITVILIRPRPHSYKCDMSEMEPSKPCHDFPDSGTIPGKTCNDRCANAHASPVQGFLFVRL